MKINELLVNLVDSVLGRGKIKSKGNRAYICPFHSSTSEKLEINFDEHSPHFQKWECWSCPKENNSKGRTILKLLRKKGVNQYYIDELNKIIPKNKINISVDRIENKILSLPKEYKTFSFNNSFFEKKALHYLYNRNITNNDIIKYNIGYCEYGKYSDRIIIPSYDNNGNINFFTGRSIDKDNKQKYKNSDSSKDVIIFEQFINWKLPIILVEGIFDAMASKRNSIPIMGKNIQPSLYKKIISQSVNKIYIALDNDALDYSLEYCQKFIDMGKKVYLVNLKQKDPSEMGFNSFTKLVQQAKPLTEYSLMELKLNL